MTSGLRPSISHGAVPEAACIGLRLFKSILDLPEPKRAGWTT
jgi:hypothetical protein